MKKSILGMAILWSFLFSGIALDSEAMIGFKCKVEILPCNSSPMIGGIAGGIISGKSRQICHENGTGLDCKCGQSTSC